jgi:hypothetical protein
MQKIAGKKFKQNWNLATTKNQMEIKFVGDKGHDPKLVEKINQIGKHFDSSELPDLIESWMDDKDLESFTDMLKERMYSNFNEYVIEYNVRSRCGTKAYSAVIIDKKEFGSDFDNMISYQDHELVDDGSIYYLEQDIEGRRTDKGNQDVIYDRAWVLSPKEGKEFLRYLESVL